jgi:hypothetical protein
MLACDQTMKAVTVSYWQLMHTITAAEPVQYQQLADKTKQYESGSQYAEFVGSVRESGNALSGPFVFVPFDGDQLPSNSSAITSSLSSSLATHTTIGSSDRSRSSHATRSAVQRAKPPSDSESAESAGEEIGASRLMAGNGSSGDELDELHYSSIGESSTAAASHQFRLLRTPSRCRECDNICFQGFECVSVSFCSLFRILS